MKFKLGTGLVEPEFEISGFFFQSFTTPVPFIRMSQSEEFSIYKHRCYNQVPQKVYDTPHSVGAQIWFIPKKYVPQGWYYPKGFSYTPPPPMDEKAFKTARLAEAKRFRDKFGMTEAEYWKKLNAKFTRLETKLPKKLIKPYIAGYQFEVMLRFMNRIAFGTVKGPGYSSYFEITYPVQAMWWIEDIMICGVDGAEPIPFGSKLPDGKKYPEFIYKKLKKPSDLQKKMDKAADVYQDAAEEFWDGNAGKDALKKDFHKKLEGK